MIYVEDAEEARGALEAARMASRFPPAPQFLVAPLTTVEMNSDQRNSSTPAQPVMPQSCKSAAERLQDLKGLLDVGAITQEEFDAKKAELFSQL